MAEAGDGVETGGHGSPRVDDSIVTPRIFVGVGVLVGAMAVLYWFTAYEDAGTVMLALSGVLALWCGVFLWLGWRAGTRTAASGQQPEPGVHATDPTYYLPHASIWPFVVGLGGAAVGNGLVLGLWVAVPGLALLLYGVVGFVRQTRHRD